MNLRELFEKLYALLAEEAELSALDDPSLPQGKIGYKLVRRSYLAKDGSHREYQYRYKYYASEGKQRYLNRKDSKWVAQVLAARARLHLVREVQRSLVSAVNRLLPEAQHISLEEIRMTFLENKALLAQVKQQSGGEKREPDKPCIAADGTVTRSRAEVIVVNLLLLLRLAFLYEPRFFTPGGVYGYRRPDFCVMTPKGIVYIEVMGMWEDEEYRREQEAKLRDYRRAGLEVGKNLMVIQISDEQKINSQVIYENLKNLFLGILPEGAIAA